MRVLNKLGGKKVFKDFYSNWYTMVLIEYYLYLAIFLNQVM